MKFKGILMNNQYIIMPLPTTHYPFNTKTQSKRFDCGSVDGFVEATNYFYEKIS